MINHNNRPAGFTLIELLVVMAIIGILAGLLLPVLAKAKHKARKAQSKSNQGQIAIGYTGYLSDNDGWFPVVNGPAGVGGKQGTAIGEKGPLPKIVAQLYGATVPESERPLNEHVGSPEMFHDPSDIGGGAYNVDSCWEQFGNSYQPQVADDMFRVKRVLGEKSEKEGSYEADSMHESEMSRTDNKIIQGDWNWPYDREDTWHAAEGEARHIMLYGDMHVEEFVFPPTEKMLQWIAPPPHANMIEPDPNFQWW
tara:strand:+ start:717 stop:1475 length:759 start_codon:yes stop_codon:yes gene_type:complete